MASSFTTTFSKTDLTAGELIVKKPSSAYNCAFGVLQLPNMPTYILGLTNVDADNIKYNVGDVPPNTRPTIKTIYNL